MSEDHVPLVRRVARALVDSSPLLSADDADALSRAYLRRWPTLAEVPELAPLPLAVFIRGFLGGDAHPFVAHRAAALGGFDPEVEGLAAGQRHACLKEGVPVAYATPLIRAYVAMGLFAGEVLRHGLDAGSATHRDGATHTVVAVAASESALAEAIDLQRRSHAGDAGARVAMGEALGYPRCCVEAFLSGTQRGDNLANEREPFLKHPTCALEPLLHRLALPRLISHHLCSPDCQLSVAGARQTLALMQAVDRAGAAWVESELGRPVLFLDYARRARLAGGWEGATFLVSAFEPVGSADWVGIAPGELASIEVARGSVVLRDRQGRVSSIPAPHPLLTAPGQALSGAALEAIQ